MKKPPRLSLITINLNNAEGLESTLESVETQKYTDFEYIIIDGGSTDGSLELIKDFHSERFPVQWISEQDKGIYNAMNKGILRSTGEYVFFLNSGDKLASAEILEYAMHLNHSADIVYGNMFICLNGHVVEKFIGKGSISFMDLYLSSVKHQATFIRRALFDKFGLYDESKRIVSDWEFFIKTLGIGNVSYKYINEYITYFDNNGISNNLHEIRISERMDVLNRYLPPMIRDDYMLFEKLQSIKPVLNRPFFFFLIKVIARVSKIIDKISRAE
jgi:glycosyltransferase involved in cell wall biosynthesis